MTDGLKNPNFITSLKQQSNTQLIESPLHILMYVGVKTRIVSTDVSRILRETLCNILLDFTRQRARVSESKAQ